MNKIITITCCALILLCDSLFGQCNGRYQTSIFGVDSVMNVAYGQNTDWLSQNQILTMDIYEPHDDTLADRPVIFFTHGGSFIGGNSLTSDVDTLCHRFAEIGYVTVSINYRLGFYPIDSTNATKAVIRAVQDQRAAIRFLKKDRATTNTYRIDTSQIWVGGSSAGAITALHSAYLNNDWEIPSSLSSWVASHGGLEGTSGNPGYSSTFRGVISLCGALGHKEWMDTSGIPMCSMHGTADAIVPYGTGWATVSNIIVILVDGDSTINAYAPSVNTEDTLYTFIGAGHVPFLGTTPDQLAYMDTTVNFISYFIFHHLNCFYSDVPEVKDFNSLITVFPNPAANNFTIIMHNYDFKPYDVELSDYLGRIILKLDNQMTKELDINTAKIAQGLYFVKITKGLQITEKKIAIK